MKKKSTYLIFLFCISAFSRTSLLGQVLSVPQIIQEQTQWCWAATTASVLSYYGYPQAQCTIAEYTRGISPQIFGTTNCCSNPSGACNNPNYLFGTNGSAQDILLHFGNISNYAVASFMSLSDIQTEISNGRPFILRWGWYPLSNGDGHMLVGRGISGSSIYYMNPLPGYGYQISDYNWLVDDGQHRWTHTEEISPQPNLTITNASIVPGTNSLTMSVTVKNVGTGTAGSSRLGYYLSTSPNSLTYLIGTANIPSLSPAATSSQNITVSLCGLNIPNGTYYANSYADDQNVVSESNENDNAYYSASPTISINCCTIPTTPVITPAGPLSVCSGVSTTLSVQSPQSGVTYFWSDGGTGITHTETNFNGSVYCWGNNSCGNSGNSNTVFINLISTQAPVTVNGGGTFCNSTTLTASGGSGGTIYWQGTTSGGISTTTASTSQVVNASGTYYFRAFSNSCGWGAEGRATVTINPTPTLNTIPNQTVCNNTATAAINFSGNTASTTFNWTNNTPSIGLAVNGTGNIASFTATNTTNTPVTATVTVTPSSAGFAYITNGGSNTVSVINTATNSVIANMPVGYGPTGVSVNPDGSRVYIANGTSNDVSVVNTTTNSVIASVSVGSSPFGICVSPDGSKVYVANVGSNNVSVINTATNSVVATVAVGLFPQGISVSPDGSRVYVTNGSSNNVSVVNASTNSVIAIVPVGSVGTSLFGISVSPDGNRVYVANVGANTISVINTVTNLVMATVSVGTSLFGISVSPDGSRIYAATAATDGSGSGSVSVINTTSNSIVANIPVGIEPRGISISPDGSRVFVANNSSNNVSVINTATNSVVAITAVGAGPYAFGNFITGIVCTGTPKTFTITVNPTITIATPAVTQPTCIVTTGTIVVNATGTSTLEYSLNGNPFVLTNTFSGLAAGIYNINVRLQSSPSCITNYSGNPVVINAATGCVQPPTANAGLPQTIQLPTNQVTLAGSGTAGTGGSITSHTWSKLSGGTATITDPSNYGTTVTGLSAGTYMFRLTVTQNDNQTATSDVTITVNAASPQPPTANAGTNQTIVLPTNQVTLAGSGAAGAGGVVTSHTWIKFSGGAATITDPSNYGTTVTGLAAGTYIFRLTVAQNDGQAAISDVTITVNTASNTKTIPGRIEAEAWDIKSGGMYAIPTTDVGGGLKVVGISNGSYMDYNVNVLTAGSYTVGFRVATTNQSTQFLIKLGTTVLATVSIPSTGGWDNWSTITVTGVSLTAGPQTLRIQSTNNDNCDFNWMDWTLPGGGSNITVTGTLTPFTTCPATASAEQTFTVAGSGLTNTLVVTAPAGFEVSTTTGSGFAGSVSLTPVAGTVNTTTIYARMAASAAGTPSGNITCTSTGVTTQNIAVSGTVKSLNLVVTSNADSGPGSLRQAVLDACSGATITFASNVTGTILLTTGEIIIRKNLTITGPGANLLSVSAGGNSRVFAILYFSPGTQLPVGVIVNINNLTISGGNGNGVIPIYTSPAYGGNIVIDSYNLVNITSSVITGSIANVGGGIFNFGTLNITNSTVSNNNSAGSGGGIYNGIGGILNMSNSTVSGNSTTNNSGGGIFNEYASNATVKNSTITNNSAATSGGGIYVNPNSSTFNSSNSIFAGNTATTYPDFYGTGISQGYNLVGKSDGSVGFTQPTDLTGTVASPLNPLLGGLANNGGPTMTHALLAGSPAIDKGSFVTGITTDQRGISRPYDNPAIPNATGGNGSDIGAYEAGPVSLPLPTANAGTNQTIILPTNQVTLAGSGAAGAGGVVTSHTWIKFSGGAATITDPSNYGTTVTGLVAGTYIFRLTVAQNDGQAAISDVTITVNTASNTKTIPGRIEAEAWDVKSGGMYAIPTTDVGGGLKVVGISNGSYMDYNVNVLTAGSYTVGFRVATTNQSTQFLIKLGTTVLATVSIPSTGGWDNWSTITVTGVSLTAGPQTLRIQSTNNDNCDFNWMDYSLTSGNQPPTANAGLPQTIQLPTSQVTLTGSGTSGNGSTLSYAWTRVSGPNTSPALTIVSPTSATTNVTGLIQGTYVFRLTVTQSDNQTATSDVTITVNAGTTQPPTANAGLPQTITLPTSQVTLTGSGTSGNGSILSYAWTRVSGPNTSPALTIVSPTSSTTNVTGLIQGTYVFRLTVTQSDNQTATSDVTITVNPVSNGKTIPGRIEAESWDVKSGGMYAIATTDVGGGLKVVGISNGSYMDYNVNVLTAGSYMVGFRVATTNQSTQFLIKLGTTVLATVSIPSTGGWDNWSTITVTGVSLTAGPQTLRIQSTNNDNCDFNWMDYSLTSGTQPPTANAGLPQTIQLPTSQVTLTGSGTSGNGSTLSYTWTRVSGPNTSPALTIVSPTSATTNVTGLIQGTYVFRLTVTQSDNQTATSDVTITVNAGTTQPPTANAGLPQTITLPTSQVTLIGSGTSGNGSTLSYAWTRVSGPNTSPALTIVSPTSATTNVTGLIQGTYVFRLTVTQSDNQTATSDVTITVNPVSNGKTIPGRIEAEAWDIKSGGMYAIPTTDVGGGLKVVGISNGSYMDYIVTVLQSGIYTVGFRVATTNLNAQFQIKLGTTVLATANIPNTGGWDNWSTITINNVPLTAGPQTLRILSTNNNSCDFNWMDYSFVSAAQSIPDNLVAVKGSSVIVENSKVTIGNEELEKANKLTVKVLPNPTSSYFNLKVSSNNKEALEIKVYDMVGRIMLKTKGTVQQTFRLGDQFMNGVYFIEVQQGAEKVVTKVIKQ